MENNYELEYEYLIRKAFGCGKDGVAGANANDFSDFLVAQTSYEKGILENKPEIDAANQASFNKGIIVAFLRNAIIHVMNKHRDTLSSVQYSELDECNGNLQQPSKEDILKVMERVNKVFRELHLTW